MSFITGQCLCKQITVSISKQAFDVTEQICICHCKNCRQCGGSLGSINIIVPESQVHISGQPKVYQDNNTDTGTTLQRAFCSNCGSPIYGITPNMPGVRVIKLGLFDEIPKPYMELYCKSRPSWHTTVDGTKQFEAMPTK